MLIGDELVLAVSAFWIVTHSGNLPADFIPSFLQVDAVFRENAFAFKINIEVIVLSQVAQILERPAHAGSFKVSFHFGSASASDLNDRAELFIEQCLVKRTVFAHKRIGHNFYADMAGKHHFAEGCSQTAVASVVISENRAFGG